MKCRSVLRRFRSITVTVYNRDRVRSANRSSTGYATLIVLAVAGHSETDETSERVISVTGPLKMPSSLQQTRYKYCLRGSASIIINCLRSDVPAGNGGLIII